MKKIILGAFLLSSVSSFSQNILRQNFSDLNTAQLSGQNSWSNSTSAGQPGLGPCAGAICQNTPIVARSMSYPNFATCTKALNPITNTNGDGVGRFFASPVTSGSVYVALLMNVTDFNNSSAMTIFRLMENGFNTATRLYIQRQGAGSFKLGLDKAGSSSSYSAATYSAYGTDMLVVVKYTFNTGSTQDDQVKLYVNPNMAAAEPAVADITFSATTTDVANITRIVFPWNSSTVPNGFYGCVSVSTSWGVTLPNPFVTNLQVNKSSNNKASISWDVANNSEVNNFTIQHSTNNSSFNDVGSVDYNDNSKFNQNIDLSNGTNYIRLATTNKQGNTVYSQVFVVKSGVLINALTISPNPTKGMLLATIKTEDRDALQLQIVDLQGKLITQQTRSVEKGETQISLDVNLLKAGQYILKVVGKTTTETKLFIKQ